MTLPSRYLSISIGAPAQDIYDYVSSYENLPSWAAGLSGSSMKQEGADWFADSPMGRVKVKFVDRNVFGVLDHFVTLPTGARFYNPMRVVPNGDGSDVVFTLFRWRGMTDEEFANDGAQIEADLRKLKGILEG